MLRVGACLPGYSKEWRHRAIYAKGHEKRHTQALRLLLATKDACPALLVQACATLSSPRQVAYSMGERRALDHATLYTGTIRFFSLASRTVHKTSPTLTRTDATVPTGSPCTRTLAQPLTTHSRSTSGSLSQLPMNDLFLLYAERQVCNQELGLANHLLCTTLYAIRNIDRCAS